MQTTMNRQIRFKCVKKYKTDKCALMEIIVRLLNQGSSCSLAPAIAENRMSKSAVKLERKRRGKIGLECRNFWKICSSLDPR